MTIEGRKSFRTVDPGRLGCGREPRARRGGRGFTRHDSTFSSAHGRARDLRRRRARCLRSRQAGTGAATADRSAARRRIRARRSRRSRRRTAPTTSRSRTTTARSASTSSTPERSAERDQQVAELGKSAEVLSVAPDQTVHATDVTDPLAHRPTLPNPNVPTASGACLRVALHGRVEQSPSGTGVRIGIVDSGVQADHEDLAGQVVAGKDFVTPGVTDGLVRLLRSRHPRRRASRRRRSTGSAVSAGRRAPRSSPHAS